jgi:tetratricopeptide (TPR) repeat protein
MIIPVNFASAMHACDLPDLGTGGVVGNTATAQQKAAATKFIQCFEQGPYPGHETSDDNMLLILFLVARSYEIIGETNNAIGGYKLLLEYFPDRQSAFLAANIGLCYLHLDIKEYSKALEYGNKALPHGGPAVQCVADAKSGLQSKMQGTPQQTQQQSKGGGCLIATAAFGSEMAPQVQFLRELRDNTVLQTESGSAFMTGFNQFYYSFSPAVADYERENPAFKEAVKITLTPLLASLTLLQYADIDSESEMLGYGIGVILLNIGMYFVAPAVLLSVCIRKISKN